MSFQSPPSCLQRRVKGSPFKGGMPPLQGMHSFIASSFATISPERQRDSDGRLFCHGEDVSILKPLISDVIHEVFDQINPETTHFTIFNVVG